MTETPDTSTLQVEVRDTLGDIAAADWDALEPDGNPFLRHAFLHALEDTGCLGESTGWFPRYCLLFEGPAGGDEIADEDTDVDDATGARVGNDDERQLIGAVPAYVKMNSYGEFVFDWAWADAFQRHGRNYYPKLVAAVPFTPATGPRLLVRPDRDRPALQRLLARALVQFATSEDYSSVHCLFATEGEQELMTAFDDDARYLARLDCQYHWQNRAPPDSSADEPPAQSLRYRDFAHFLAGCTAKRRKTLKRERRYVTDAGLRVERRRGDTLSDAEWRTVHAFYSSTFDRKWGNPSLSAAFFRRIGATFGENTLIVFAYDPTDDTPDEPVACSVMFQGGDTLYGRYWGCRRDYNALHFEACYYQGIEHCIEQGLDRFEPGAQGEHKITRGFEPTLTRSAHWIAHDGFRDAVERYLDEERPHMRERCNGLSELLPFKSTLTLP